LNCQTSVWNFAREVGNFVLTEALLKILPVLDSLDASYALIGGLALAPHDVVRATEDLDFLLADSPQRMMELARQVEAKGFHVVTRKGAFDDRVAAVIVVDVPVGLETVACDLIFPSFRWQAEAVRNAESVDLQGVVVRVVGARDLFLLKLYAGGPLDLLDAANLLRRQAPQERGAWKEAAAKLRLGKEYQRCLQFMKG
jgi:hypothetical protein